MTLLLMTVFFLLPPFLLNSETAECEITSCRRACDALAISFALAKLSTIQHRDEGANLRQGGNHRYTMDAPAPAEPEHTFTINQSRGSFAEHSASG